MRNKGLLTAVALSAALAMGVSPALAFRGGGGFHGGGFGGGFHGGGWGGGFHGGGWGHGGWGRGGWAHGGWGRGGWGGGGWGWGLAGLGLGLGVAAATAPYWGYDAYYPYYGGYGYGYCNPAYGFSVGYACPYGYPYYPY